MKRYRRLSAVLLAVSLICALTAPALAGNGSFFNGGTFHNGGSITNTGYFQNEGEFTNAGSLSYSGSSFFNYGSLKNDSGGTFSIPDGAIQGAGLLEGFTDHTAKPATGAYGNSTAFQMNNGTLTVTVTPSSGETSVTLPASLSAVMSSDGGTFLMYKNAIKSIVVTISESASIEIPDDAFENLPNLTSVTLDVNVRKIGAGAFSGCTKLTSVNYAGTVSSWAGMTLEYQAFPSGVTITTTDTANSTITVVNGVTTALNSSTDPWVTMNGVKYSYNSTAYPATESNYITDLNYHYDLYVDSSNAIVNYVQGEMAGGSTGDASGASGILYVQSVTVGEDGASSSVTGQWYSSDARVYTANSELAKTLNAGKPYHVTLDTGNVITSANAMTELTLSEDFSSSDKLIKTSSNSAGYDTSEAVWYKISGTTESSSVSQTNDIPSTLYGGKAIYVEFINSPDANRIQTIYYRADTAAT